jgi:hypothetical protein
MLQTYQENGNLPRKVIYNGSVVLTTEQLGQALATDPKQLNKNFLNNKNRYQENVHFYLLKNNELKAFKNEFQFLELAPTINQLYLWTEKGCFYHTKSLGTDEAWDAFNVLVETYFRVKEILSKPLTPSELILQQAQALVLQERAIADLQAKQNLLEEKVHQVESHQTTLNKDYYSLAGYYNLQKVRWNLSPAQAQQTGKKCKKVSEELGYDHFKTQDARFGMVGLYHLHVLKAVLGF